MIMQPKMRLVLLLAASIVSTTVAAQPADPAPSEPADPATKPKATESKASDQSGKEKPASSEDKAFIPTEEISEDFAVSFPVDI